MAIHDWVKEFPGTVTVCDFNGIILEMNDKAAQSVEAEGGIKLIGSNLLDCHPEPARSRVKQLLDEHQSNIYTIEKNGVKKLVYQTPWYTGGKYGGIIELVLEIPAQMPHFVRDP